jgi:hypothetical protein
MGTQISVEFEEAYERLVHCADSLKTAAEMNLPQIREAFDPNHPLPENCPSRASLAAMIFRHVRKKQVEVNGAIEDVEKAIWKIGC